MITGESEPVDIEVHAVDTNALEARNLIFNGSLIVDGSCFAVVVKTGDATLIGTMVGLTGDVGKASSTLKADIEHFVKIVTLFALMQAALIFIVGLSRGYDPLTVFIYGFVVIMIGNVPQGLPTTVTASLYLVAERMSRQNVFVKKLDIIETLGACTLICTDKTGTLTMNQMTVSHLWLPAMDSVSFTAESFAQHLLTNPSIVASSTSTAMQLLSIGSLNSRVELEGRQENETAAVKAGSTKDKTEDPNSTSNTEVSPTGDATELGLYRFFSNILRQLPQQGQPLRHEYDAIEQFRSKHPKVHEIPFNSSFKWQMSIHHLPQTKQHVLFLKGAPDVLLSKCRFYLTAENTIAPMGEAFQASYQQKYEEFGGQGERVLGFAMRYFDAASEGNYEDQCKKDSKFHEHLRERLIGKSNHSKVSAQGNTASSTPVEPLNDLIFVGLITLMDPPRPEVPKAIQDCYSAHVKVIMVTGDHPLTAASIARQIGLLTKPTTKAEVAALKNIPEEDVTDEDIPAVVIHGQSIPKMTEEDWQRLTKKEEIVFARTSPEQKLTIVQEFTKAGHITAMTGDGVNDSPALKQAAIGIAMGLNGSAVAKEAADVVLLDDNFASIVTGIREGRLLFANLKKSIAYSLAHLTPEVIPVLMWGFAGVVQPMGSLLALCVDLLTELVPATSFVFEDPEDMIMQLPPRNPKTDKLTSWNLLFYAYGQAGMILTGGCLFYFFRAFQHYGVSPFQVMNNNNRFFPASSSDNIITVHKDGETHVYDEHDQKEILRVVQAGWYLMIVIGQVSHLYQCRTTRMSIFTHGLFRNSISNIGAVLAIVLGCFVVYCPGIRDIVSAAYPVSLEIFYASLLVSGAMWINGEGRKYILRTYPEHPVSKILAW
jgi:sodium/potassium-transporting ATPase subunit alpha